MNDFFNKFYASAVVQGTPYSEVWINFDGRILGVMNGVFHQLTHLPDGFFKVGVHPLDSGVWVFKFQTGQ